MTTYKGTPFVLAADNSTNLELCTDYLYAPKIYFDTLLEGAGGLRAGNLTCSQWFDNTPINMNAAANTQLLVNAGAGSPSDPLNYITESGGVFTIGIDANSEVTFTTTLSTSDAQAVVSFRKNGTAVRSFYTPYVPGSTALMPFSCSFAIRFSVGDTFDIVSSPVTGATLNTGGPDGVGNAQTLLLIKLLGV